MNVEYEATRIKQKLEKVLNQDRVDNELLLDLLRTLGELKINLEILQKTRVGYVVNNVRKKAEKESVVNLAKALIKEWKKLLPDKKSAINGKGNENQTKLKDIETNDQDQSSQSSSITMDFSSTNESSSSTKDVDDDDQANLIILTTGDRTRDHSRKLLAGALNRQDSDISSAVADVPALAAAIEDCIYKEFKGTNMKYKNRVRSRIANLKDPKNPNLCYKVLSGNITPEQIAKMTAEEMASDEMKKLRRSYTTEAIRNAQMAVTQGTKTDLLTCGRCRKKNCSYNQMQTRSADEPMTTFAFCHECGHRWKNYVQGLPESETKEGTLHMVECNEDFEELTSEFPQALI